jgi:hypothetical protein
VQYAHILILHGLKRGGVNKWGIKKRIKKKKKNDREERKREENVSWLVKRLERVLRRWGLGVSPGGNQCLTAT